MPSYRYNPCAPCCACKLCPNAPLSWAVTAGGWGSPCFNGGGCAPFNGTFEVPFAFDNGISCNWQLEIDATHWVYVEMLRQAGGQWPFLVFFSAVNVLTEGQNQSVIYGGNTANCNDSFSLKYSGGNKANAPASVTIAPATS